MLKNLEDNLAIAHEDWPTYSQAGMFVIAIGYDDGQAWTDFDWERNFPTGSLVMPWTGYGAWEFPAGIPPEDVRPETASLTVGVQGIGWLGTPAHSWVDLVCTESVEDSRLQAWTSSMSGLQHSVHEELGCEEGSGSRTY